MAVKTVWCVFDTHEKTKEKILIYIFDDEDKAINCRKVNPQFNIQVEEWDIR